jgi:filamentous hemagglutinin family protein
MRNRLRLAVLAALSSSAAAAGEITIDGTLPGTTAGPLDAVSGSYAITQNRGLLAGTNLFHSFGAFNLDRGETAVFSGAASITNIISRVTGGIPTTIDGTLRSTIAGANFWFVNPAGLTLGPNGVLDVSGAIALGAADSIGFADGARFLALPGRDETAVSLLVSSPVDFGFLPESRAGVLTLRSPGISSSSGLLLSGGSGVLLESQGDLTLVDARIRTNAGEAGTGAIEIAAAGSINIIGSDLLTSTGAGSPGVTSSFAAVSSSPSAAAA